ncbi:hypothetical protein QFC22_005891 [Naganishia vaughanmartiniae]|uniref:Uncharacterized protein n=1 Tax=Naganishia vaughanmartiniae TaxID=1424756 RepID=A0ACC2WTD9_9TREE|nr:hypothetical protein QFC22_005891 [Naganishia vaughanmartiniae]
MPRIPKNPKPFAKKKTAPLVTQETAPKKKSGPAEQRGSKQAETVKQKEAPRKPRPAARAKNAKGASKPLTSDQNVGTTHGAIITVNDPPPTSATVSPASGTTFKQTQPLAPGISSEPLNHDAAMQIVMEENRRLKKQLESKSHVSLERPSERKRNNPYDIAPLRRILGLHVIPEDPDFMKELKNEAYNFLRETARDVVGAQELAKTIDRGAHWDYLLDDKQKLLKEQFVSKVRKGGAFSLTFFTPPADGNLSRFALDWPANELLKTVLRDQRLELKVKMKNTRSKLLYGNVVFNELHQQFNGRCAFPSEPVVRQAKGPKQHRLGRPPKDPLLQASLSMSSESRDRLKVLDRSTREKYRGNSASPEFDFEPTGKITMPVPKFVEKKKKKKGIQDPPTDSLDTGTGWNRPLAPNTNISIPSPRALSKRTRTVASVDMSINDIEEAYGGFDSNAAGAQLESTRGAKQSDPEGEDLPLPDYDEDDEDQDQVQDQGYDTDDNGDDSTASGSDLSSSVSGGSGSSEQE